MPLAILTGQTASGKSAVAISLARATGAEIISVDSVKVYTGLDIGAAKPSASVRREIPFHLVDVVQPQETFTLAQFLKGAEEAAADAASRRRKVLYAGGTPLYLRGLLYGIFEGPAASAEFRDALKEKAACFGSQSLHEELARVDPRTASRLHPNDLRRIIRALEVTHQTGRPVSELQRQFPAPRPAVEYRMVALRRSDDDLRPRIDARVDRMFAAGLVEEVRAVLRRGNFSPSAEKAIGYREVLAYLRGETDLPEAVAQVKRSTWRMARKQRTWLKSFPDVCWLDVRPDEPVEETCARVRELLFGPELMN